MEAYDTAWLDEADARARAALDLAQEGLRRDPTASVLKLGALMVFAGCALMVAGVPFAFSLTTMVWGALLCAIAVVARHRAEKTRAAALETVRGTLRDALEVRARVEALQQVFASGAPSTWSAAEITLLMSRRPEP